MLIVTESGVAEPMTLIAFVRAPVVAFRVAVPLVIAVALTVPLASVFASAGVTCRP
jgi:hypothetical protein